MLQASGDGHAIVWVTDELDVELGGTAAVQYYGTPAVSQSTGDLSGVTSLGAK
jgi:hypothetical protein